MMNALITGASAGIGRDMAVLLAEQGYDLTLVARRADRLEALARSLPVRVRVLALDLSRAEDCHALYEQTRDQLPDLLINNAGVGLFGPFDETPLDRELSMLNVNLRAVHILTKLFLPDFKARGSGRILNVASSAAFLPGGPLFSAYYASKAYVYRLSRAVQEELRRANSAVTVSLLCPGPVHTEFGETADVRFAMRSLSSGFVARHAVKHLLRGTRVITPGIQAKAVHLLAHLVPEGLLLRICWHVQKKKRP